MAATADIVDIAGRHLRRRARPPPALTFAQAVAVGTIGSAGGRSSDLGAGTVIRFRTLPRSLAVVLAGRTRPDLARNLVVAADMTAARVAVGFRPHTGVVRRLAGLGPVAVLVYAAAWDLVALGLRVSAPEAARAAAVPVAFLRMFASPALVPRSTMPDDFWAVGAHQPGTARVEPERSHRLDGPAAAPAIDGLAWWGGMLIAFGALATSTHLRPNH